MMPANHSGIKDNRPKRGTVASFLKEKIKNETLLSFVSAYFTIYAYEKLKTQLDSIKNLRFLFGEPRFTTDPDKTDAKAYNIADNELSLANQLEQKRIAKDCADWIREKVEIRSMIKSNLLHGKIYHIKEQNGTEEALIGSSNFTVSGLGLGANPNIELNLVMNDRRDILDLLDWFNELWNDKTLTIDVKDKVLQHMGELYAENAPEFIYYKTLFHVFGEFLSDQQKGGLLDEKTGFYETKIWKMLYDFQRDGVKGAINKILRFNGCVLADSVGLGKTFEALAVIKYFELLNARILVLCPKKLRSNWTLHLLNDKRNILFEDRFSYNVLSHTDLSRTGGKVGDIDLANHNWGNYDLLVIDESHNFRNDTYGRTNQEGKYVQTRYEHLMENVLKSGRDTKVLLLSATPVNNNLKDLRNQIYLITKSAEEAFSSTLDIANIGQTMRNAQTQFTNWADAKKNPTRKLRDLMDSLGSDFFKLLDSLTIARSRVHIKSHYRLENVGKFPERMKPLSFYTEIDLLNNFPSYDKIEEEIHKYKLSLFNPSKYIKEEFLPIYEEKFKGIRNITAYKAQENREHFLIGMMKVNFLKRLESSIESFEISMERTIGKIDRLIEKIRNFDENYDEHTQPNLIGKDSEPFSIEDSEEIEEMLEVGSKLKFKLEHLKINDWLKDLNKDRDQILVLLNNAKLVDAPRDAKLAKLKELIKEKISNPINANNKKILIFTAFSDTATYLYESLQPWISEKLVLNCALITGSGDNKTTFRPPGFATQTDFESIIANFSPLSKDRVLMSNMPQDGQIDILIATDCISEGQNLQDCDCVINYDIHWNPVRIIQRFGRVDRIGSKNGKIRMINFWPTQDLNKYIHLKERVEARMALVNLTATGEDDLLNQEQLRDLIKEEDMTFRQKQLLRLKDEVLDLEEMDGNVSLTEFTLDDFRMDLLNYLQENKKVLENAPFGLYAVVPADLRDKADLFNAKLAEIIQPGVIFCLKHTNSKPENREVNPLNPYFLAYVRDDGTVRYSYTHPKQILRAYQALCAGKTAPLAELCESFNKGTNDGKNMENYNALLGKAVRDIIGRVEKKNLGNLFTGRGGKLLNDKGKIKDADDFELITWLVII